MSSPPTFDAAALDAVLADTGIQPQMLAWIEPAQFAQASGPLVRGKGSVLIGPIGAGLDIPAAAKLYRRHAAPGLAEGGTALFFFRPPRSDQELARWRNQLWPWLHVVAIYRISQGHAARQTLQGTVALAAACGYDGLVMVARPRELVLSPRATVEKFDQNAPSWNPAPGSPGYRHYRWMRRLVARLATVPRGARVLDFGCGAGWVGIEAARSSQDVELCAFDPSPEMVKSAEQNARARGVARFCARTGFGEAPPFPAKGEAPFECVFSSGVVSFSPDIERWTDGLVSTLRPGGTLVIGDIHRESRGMQKRRATRPLLPAREMNAQTATEMRARLERRGLVHERTLWYQLSDPFPQLIHHADQRLGGLLAPPLLWSNRLASRGWLAPKHFDSWAMRLHLRG